MRRQRELKPSGTMVMLVSVAVAAIIIGIALANSGQRRTRLPAERYSVANVRRLNLTPAVTASGTIESSKRTVIECDLENISIGVLGQRLTAGGASVLLSIVPDGSTVHKGDVLAVLDSSEYEELLRQQKITVERSRADFRQAELAADIAKLAVIEFRDGSMTEAIKDFERSLALAKSDMVRVKDRLEWVRKMKSKGYVALSQVTNEEFNYARTQFNLGQEEAAYELFTRWMAPRSLKVLEGKVLAAGAILSFERMRLARNLERLTKLERQVELCTIRAPHDGFVIYANDERRDLRIETGMSVRQKQDLMYLPDLSDLEVVTSLHESVVPDVSRGMRASVLIEALPEGRIDGRVTQIAQLPTFSWRSEVRYFDGRVKLEHPPRGVLPGMTAQVEISLGTRDSVLAVPPEAVSWEDGREICYVLHDEGLERREVELGDGTRDLLEVSRGLQEGEQVVLNPVLAQVLEDTSEQTSLVWEESCSSVNDSLVDASTEPAQQVTALR